MRETARNMIYLDNSATTRPYDAVIERMARAMREEYVNPSAAYAPALAGERAADACRARIAGALGAAGYRVCFTSGGTESDNLAILGTAETLRARANFAVSAVEHPAVAETVKRAAALGHEVRVLPVTREGVVDPAQAEEILDENTAFLSCMHVNNETGAIQPVAALARLVRKKNPKAVVHVDGVQAFLRVPLSLPGGMIDCYSLSGHKIHGPKGIGALVYRQDLRLVPQATGGGQERGLRSGTTNLPAILGLGEAIAATPADAPARLRALKLRLWEQLRDGEVLANGPDPADEERSAPHILSLSFPGVRGEVLRNALEGEGILVSTGSACASHKQKVSPGLLATGMDPRLADGTIRVSLGLFNTEEEMDRAAEAMRRLSAMLRKYQRR